MLIIIMYSLILSTCFVFFVCFENMINREKSLGTCKTNWILMTVRETIIIIIILQ